MFTDGAGGEDDGAARVQSPLQYGQSRAEGSKQKNLFPVVPILLSLVRVRLFLKRKICVNIYIHYFFLFYLDQFATCETLPCAVSFCFDRPAFVPARRRRGEGRGRGRGRRRGPLGSV